MTALALTLTLSALAQPGAVPAPDAPFRLVVESWVIAHRRPGVSVAAITTRQASDALIALASDKAGVRRLGRMVLLSQPEPARMRAVAWGTGSKDAEVRSMCWAIWDTYYLCNHCFGTRTHNWGTEEGPVWCRTCKSWGRECRVCAEGP